MNFDYYIHYNRKIATIKEDGQTYKYSYIETTDIPLCMYCRIDRSGLYKFLFPCNDCQAFHKTGKSYFVE
jgi:hypothetical protein